MSTNEDGYFEFKAKVDLILFVYRMGMPARNGYGHQAVPRAWQRMPIHNGRKPDNDNLSYLHW